MEGQISTPKQSTVSSTALRVILIALIIGLSIFKLSISYRGLDQSVAMDQAQIARELCQGNGFTTKVLRPMDIKNAAREQKSGLDLDHFKDTTHAPLNVYAMAAALKLTGYDRFEAHRMLAGQGNIYNGDRIISGVSMLFFLGALALAYTLVTRIFDEVVAASTVAFLALSELMLRYASSGLPQPLMMCCMLGAMHFLLSSIQASRDERNLAMIIHIALAFVCITLLCLTSWMAIWVALGLIIFCAAYFRPFGAFAVPGLIILSLGLLLPLLSNTTHSGSLMGNAYYALYNCFGSGEDLVLRTTTASSLPLDNTSFMLRLVGYTFKQLDVLYVAMGSIIVTPFFFLTLLNRYKTVTAEGIKWATFSMWAFGCIGMALYGVTTSYDATQLAPIFAPIFTAYGVALVFNFLSRLQLGAHFGLARSLTLFIMITVSAGAFLFSLPGEFQRGLWLRDKGLPQYPPYYPSALNAVSGENKTLAELSNEKDIIVSDQPWAVAWYANRKSLWTPLRIDDYTNDLEPIIEKAGAAVQGFLVTPSSHSPRRTVASSRPGGIEGLQLENGDFAPLAMEGSLLMMVPQHNLALTDHFSTTPNKMSGTKPLGNIVSSSGQFPQRHFLLGTAIMYYSKANTQIK